MKSDVFNSESNQVNDLPRELTLNELYSPLIAGGYDKSCYDAYKALIEYYDHPLWLLPFLFPIHINKVYAQLSLVKKICGTDQNYKEAVKAYHQQINDG